jgi:heptosyltransferase-3
LPGELAPSLDPYILGAVRILFITHTRIGDAVLSTGLLSRLIDEHPDARVTIACGAPARGLFMAVPGLEEIHVIEKQPRGRHWLELWRHMAGRRWDVLVDLRGSVMAYLLWANERHVMRKADQKVHRLVQLARVLGSEKPFLPRLWTWPEQWEAARELVPDGPPVLAVGPTANWRGKMWRGSRFTELIERLTAPDGMLPNARVVVLGSAEERNLAQPVLAGLRPPRRIDLIGKIDLLTAYTVLRRCAMYIGNDSGLMHLSAAAGIPTLGLFGPSRIEHYAPWGERAGVVCTPIPFQALVGAPGYDHRTTDTLMDSLTVDMVEEAAVELYRRSLGQAA